MQRFSIVLMTLLWVCAAVAAISGCPATGAVGVAPITAVSIPISTILQEENLGCGEGPDDVYEYAVMVAYSQGEPGGFDGGGANGDGGGLGPTIDSCPNAKFFGAVFPCFATATFANLPLSDASFPEGGLIIDSGALPDGGSVAIWAWVAFYNKATFDRIGRQKIIRAASTSDDGGDGICGLGATWTTTCTATEEDNVVSTASCKPLVFGSNPPPRDATPPSEAAVRDTQADQAPLEGGLDGAVDGPVEAAPEAAVDAGDAGTLDGGTDAPLDVSADAPPG